jgi:hypothetical protein
MLSDARDSKLLRDRRIQNAGIAFGWEYLVPFGLGADLVSILPRAGRRGRRGVDKGAVAINEENFKRSGVAGRVCWSQDPEIKHGGKSTCDIESTIGFGDE